MKFHKHRTINLNKNMRHSTKIDHLFKKGDPIEEDLTNVVVLITTKHIIIATINQIAHIHHSINSGDHRHLSTNPIVHNLHLIDNLEDISKVRKEALHHKGIHLIGVEVKIQLYDVQCVSRSIAGLNNVLIKISKIQKIHLSPTM